MPIQRGELIRQSDVTWKTVSTGSLIYGSDAYNPQSQGTLITPLNFNISYNYNNLDYFRDGTQIQYYPLEGNQNDMGNQYNQTASNVIYITTDKIQGSYSQKLSNNTSNITLLSPNNLQNLIFGNRSWTISVFFKVYLNYEYFFPYLPMNESTIINWINILRDFMSIGYSSQYYQGLSITINIKAYDYPSSIPGEYYHMFCPGLELNYYSSQTLQTKSISISPERWYSLILTYNNSNTTLNIYLNGAKYSSPITSWNNSYNINSQSPLNISSNTIIKNQDGTIISVNDSQSYVHLDNIRIFNRQLSDSEVQALHYETSLTPSTTFPTGGCKSIKYSIIE